MQKTIADRNLKGCIKVAIIMSLAVVDDWHLENHTACYISVMSVIRRFQQSMFYYIGCAVSDKSI
jgi:hypothetical protein